MPFVADPRLEYPGGHECRSFRSYLHPLVALPQEKEIQWQEEEA